MVHKYVPAMLQCRCCPRLYISRKSCTRQNPTLTKKNQRCAERIYLESGHGKGEVDSIGSRVKQHLRSHAMDSNSPFYQKLVSAAACWECCVETMGCNGAQTYRKPSDIKRRTVHKTFFYLVDKPTMVAARAARGDWKGVKGTQKFHAVRSVPGHPGVIEHRNFDCACPGCYAPPDQNPGAELCYFFF